MGHRSKFYLKCYNLAISGGSEWARPCQHVGTSSFQSMLWQLKSVLTEKNPVLVTRDFKTTACVQAYVLRLSLLLNVRLLSSFRSGSVKLISPKVPKLASEEDHFPKRQHRNFEPINHNRSLQ